MNLLLPNYLFLIVATTSNLKRKTTNLVNNGCENSHIDLHQILHQKRSRSVMDKKSNSIKNQENDEGIINKELAIEVADCIRIESSSFGNTNAQVAEKFGLDEKKNQEPNKALDNKEIRLPSQTISNKTEDNLHIGVKNVLFDENIPIENKKTQDNTKQDINDLFDEYQGECFLKYRISAKITTIKRNDIIVMFKNLKNYAIPSAIENYDFKPFFKKINGEYITSIKKLLILENPKNNKEMIRYFSKIFCNLVVLNNLNTFTIKKEFVLLQLYVPELLPLIKYLNMKLKNQKDYNEDNFVEIIELNKKLKVFFDKFCNVLSENIKQKSEDNEKNKKDEIIVEMVKKEEEPTQLKAIYFESMKHKSMIFEFREIIVDLLKILKAAPKLITNYEFLLHIGKGKKDPENNSQYAYTKEIMFFIYFIINSDINNVEFMNKISYYNDLINGTTILSEQNLKDIWSLECYIRNNSTTLVCIDAFEFFLSKTTKPRLSDHIEDFEIEKTIKLYRSNFYYNSKKENANTVVFNKLTSPILLRLFYFLHQQNMITEL